MTSTFEQLKKNRKNNFSKLASELDKAAGKSDFKNEDERFWSPSVDKTGNGSAIIRFLPAPKGEDVPFVRVFDHYFQGDSGSWYVEKSLTTLGRQDPVSEYNSKLWNAGGDGSPERAQARKQKRRLNFYSNIYVVKDPAHPENEGKVFLFKYGKQIFDVLYAASAKTDEHDDEEKIDPFDLWEGANFRLKARNKDGYRNYETSKFDAPSPLFKKDEEMKRVWEQAYPLQPFVDPKTFKSYDELREKFYRVIGEPTTSDREELPTKAAPSARTAPPREEPDLVTPRADDDDEDLKLFNEFANESEEELIS